MRRVLGNAWQWLWGTLAGVFLAIAVLCVCVAAGLSSGREFLDTILDSLPDEG